MDLEELHSEYRSTYHWHEYKSAKHEVIEKPPQTSFGNDFEDNKADGGHKGGTEMEPQLPRRKKNPAYAYRTHSFLKSPSNNSNRHVSTSLDRARCSERDAEGSSRRSKSEGPQSPGPSNQYKLLRSDSDPSDFAQQLVNGDIKYSLQGKECGKISTEYRLQFAWPGMCKVDDEIATPLAKKSFSMGTIKGSNNINLATNAEIPQTLHKKENVDPKKRYAPVPSGESEPLVNGEILNNLIKKSDIKSDGKDEEIRPIFSWSDFNTEYKKKFRPFSQYNYIEGVFKPKAEPEVIPPDFGQGETWFREVIELRKKAGQYKHRGWGTELVPEHIAELYNKQISLWEHVARRSSLEALSLASTDKKTKDDDGEYTQKSLPSRALWVEFEGGKNESNRNRTENFLRYNFERSLFNAGRSQVGSNEQRSENKSPKKSARMIFGPGKTGTNADRSEKSQRPTCLPTALSEVKPSTATKEIEGKPKKPDGKGRLSEISPTNSLLTNNKRYKPNMNAVCGPTDVFKNIVKSPPEPTKVKSPEQIILRSPEPVNWTVPLDTGKTFTVTQNVSAAESDYEMK